MTTRIRHRELRFPVQIEWDGGRRPAGGFGFTGIEQVVRAQTGDEHAHSLRALVAKAEETCLVAVSHDLPVATTIEIRRRVAV